MRYTKRLRTAKPLALGGPIAAMIRAGDEPIPGYRVERLLGHGQFGEVWQATSPGRSQVALKFLDMTGRKGWKEFRAVQRVKQIRHAHLMPIVALWLLDERGEILTDDTVERLLPCANAAETIAADDVVTTRAPARMVIATLLGDKSLRECLDEHKLAGRSGIPVDELIGYMQEAAKGIDYLNSVKHEWQGSQVGVQHCDIKPDNMMLVGDSVMICDFGVAQILGDGDRDNRATSLSGSPAYMAPEAFEAKPHRASDQYSLAVSYYELRTGRLPMEGETFAAAYNAHRDGTLDFSIVPERERVVLKRATQREPRHRYASAVEFAEALRASRQAIPGLGRVALSVVALALVATLVAGGTLAYQWWQQPRIANIQLQLDGAHLNVLVGDQELISDENGTLPLQVAADAPLTLVARGNEGRQDRTWTITPDQIADDATIKLDLPFTATHHAAVAEQALQAGHSDEAVAAYVLALNEDPTTYSILPAAVQRQGNSVPWDECVQVTPNDEQLVVADEQGQVATWGLQKAKLANEAALQQSESVASPSSLVVGGDWYAVADAEGAIEYRAKDWTTKLTAGESVETHLAVTRDGNWLVAARVNELQTTIVAWDLRSNDLSASRREVGHQPGEFPRLVPVLGDSIVVATKDATALVWQWNISQGDNKEIGRQTNDVLGMAASEDGGWVAFAGVPDADNSTPEHGPALVDTTSAARFPFSAPQNDSIQACAVGDNGKLVATAERSSGQSEHGIVALWKPSDNVLVTDRLLQYDRAAGDVSAVAIALSGDWIAAGHEGGGVSLWHLPTMGEVPLLTVGEGDRMCFLDFDRDERRLIAVARDGRIIAIDLARTGMIARACKETGKTPRPSGDRVTLRDPRLSPPVRWFWVDTRIASLRPGRPTAALGG